MGITYFTNQVSTTGGAPMQGYTALGLQTEEFKFTIPAAGLQNTDSIVLAQLPLNSTLLAFYISTAQIDSNGTPTLTSKIGDTSSTARYVATTSTIGRTAVDVWMNAINAYVAGSMPFTYTTQTSSPPTGIVLSPSQNIADYLLWTFTAANATATTSGTIKGFVVYTLNPNATI